jgi:drug/metabolite transporter (DMT)-like permease
MVAGLPQPRVAWALIALALLSTAAGYIVYFALLARAGATNVLLVTLLIPPSALLLGALFLAESVEPRDLGGLACIAAGLAAIDGRLLRWLRWRVVSRESSVVRQPVGKSVRT